MSTTSSDSLLRRAAPAVVLAGAAGALFVALDHPAGAVQNAQPAPASTSTATPSTSAAAPSATSPSATAAPATRTASPTTRTTAGPTTTGSNSACAGQTVTGSSVSTRFGPVQIQATFNSSGVLCAVNAVAYPSSDNRSMAINARAIPTLNAEALATKTAAINAVTGATITSNAYKSSLQSILDKR